MSATRVAIVGGGLAGLATAVTLADRGIHVELFEARRTLGGRAGSFRDPESGELVDHCQHVAMGCCTAWLDFCRRTGIDSLLRRDRVLNFIAPDGTMRRFAAVGWLPAPLHLAPAFLRLTFLSLGERLAVAKAMMQLARENEADYDPQAPTIGQWLRRQGQTERAIEQFWGLVLTSALGETVERASLAAARKVFVDGFLKDREAHEIYLPRVPLGELYDVHVAGWLKARGVVVKTGSPIARIAGDERGATHLELPDGSRRHFDHYVVATTWHQAQPLLDPALASAVPALHDSAALESSPITAVHLWFDRPITRLPHAVLVGKLSQWVFARPIASGAPLSDGHYYQVVISASQSLAARRGTSVAQQVVDELMHAFPRARDAKLLRSRVVTQRDAVFSPRPGTDRLRPPQRTRVPNLFLAGDWTATGWPATMESAVRSGYAAAEGVLEAIGIQ
ncbi:MAG: hydroxysqualene dehydroxylase HpnE, partial [Pirellulales bacterium]